MKLIKVLLFISFILTSTHLVAVTIFSDTNNKVDLTGDFNLSYFNKLENEQILSYIKNNYYYSTLGVAFENHSLATLLTSLVFDVKINNKAYYQEEESQNLYKTIEMNNFYIGLKADDTTTKIGIFDSLVSSQTVLATNKEGVYWLDAGYSFMNMDPFLGDKNGEDFSTTKIQGIGHSNSVSNFTINLEVSSPKNNLTARNSVEENLISKRYSVAGSISYQGDIIGYSIGYVRVGNKIKDKSVGKFLRESMINSDNILSSFSLSAENLYFAVSGGYYKNQKLAGITHTGASAFLSYQLTKLVPYVGYQFLYANNINSSIKDGKDIYNLKDRKNYSFDQSVFIIGLSFKVHDGLFLGIEHINDIRSESQIDSSLLNTINQDVTSIYIKYSI